MANRPVKLCEHGVNVLHCRACARKAKAISPVQLRRWRLVLSQTRLGLLAFVLSTEEIMKMREEVRKQVSKEEFKTLEGT